MSEIRISLDEKEINAIMSCITVACGESTYFNSTKDMFFDKCVEQGVVFDREYSDEDSWRFYISDINVRQIVNNEESLLNYSVVENNGEYFVVGDNDWFSKSYKTAEQANEVCKEFNEVE